MNVQTNTNVSHPALLKLKAAVREHDPEAEVVLFGSRARNEAKTYSDWDILVVSRLANDSDFKDKVNVLANRYLLDHEVLLSVFHFDQDRWNKGDSPSPFYDNIREEGIYV